MFMAEDIRNQPEAFRRMAQSRPSAWEEALARLGDLSRYRRVLFTGMGSSYFASIAGAYALNRWGLPAVAELTSTLLYYGERRLQPDDLLVLSSQSGESAEVVKFLERLGAGRPATLTVTNRPDSPGAQLADAVLSLDVPPDHGVAVKTYGATTLALLWLGMRLTGRRTDSWAQHANRAAEAVAAANAQADAWRRLGQEMTSIPAAVVIGRGPSLSAAWSGALLLNEVAKVPAWAEDGGEFRHGVVEVAGPDFLAAVLLADGPTRELGVTLSAELAEISTRVLAIAPAALQQNLSATSATVLLINDLDELFLPLLQVVPLQWVSLGWAEARGFEPGRFRHTPGVIRSEVKEVNR